MRGPHSQSHPTLQYRGHVRDKKCYISTFTRQDADLGWVNLTCKVTWHINHVVIWQMKNVLSPLSQGLWTPNLAGCWLRMRGPHPQSHVMHQSRGHVTNQKRFMSTFTKFMSPKTWQGAESKWGGSTQKATWHFSCEVTWKIRNIISQPQGYPQGYRDVKGKLVLAKNKHKNAN